MSYNMTPLDIVVRLTLAMVFVIIGWLLNTFILYPIGMVFLVVALTGYCPLKAIFSKKGKGECNWD